MTNKKILLVEDHKYMAQMLRYNLQAEGYQVLEAVDGEEALRLAREEGPDMILLDVMLPKLDGFEVTKQLKAAEETQAIPIIMVTSLGQSQEAQKGLRLGAIEYITKPFSPQDLLEKIRAHLGDQ